jgi:hypothetical protein
MAFTYVLDIVSVVRRTLGTVIDFFVVSAAKAVTVVGGLADAAKQFMSGDFSGAMDTWKSTMRQADTMNQDFVDKQKAAWSDSFLGADIRKRIEAIQSHTKETEKATKSREAGRGLPGFDQRHQI